MDQHGGRATTRRAGGALGGTDAWSREARWVWELAAHLGLALDEEELVLRDVHDLQRLHVSLHRLWTGPAGRRWSVLRRLRDWVRAGATAAVAARPRRA